MLLTLPSSAVRMRGVCLFFIFLMLLPYAAEAQSIITVDVNDNGDALWTMKKQLPLATQTEVADWEEFIKTGQDGYQKDIADFSQRMEWFILSAQEFSNRPMRGEKFNISYSTVKTPTGAFGIVQYSFEWKNFSHSDSSKISIGDAFSEGMVLSSDNVLVIKIPDGYEVESASPGFDKRDGNRLIWDGTLYPNFGKGEPAVVLSRSGTGSTWLLVVVLVIISASAVFFKRRRKPETENKAVPPEDQAVEDLKYEEMIEQFLIKSGGQASQSEIIEEIGLSKSRVSTILAKMKENGQIIKIRNGRGNLIRLAMVR